MHLSSLFNCKLLAYVDYNMNRCTVRVAVDEVILNQFNGITKVINFIYVAE